MKNKIVYNLQNVKDYTDGKELTNKVKDYEMSLILLQDKVILTEYGQAIEYKYTDFEVINVEKGRPKVVLGFDIKGLEGIDISLSHCKEYAVAYVSAIIKE